MRIYIAAPYAARDQLRRYADSLKSWGHTVTSSWLEASHEIGPGSLETAPALTDEYATQHSLKDIEEVKDSDLLIFIPWKKAEEIHGRPQEMGANSGGRHVECGVALASSIPVIVWGQPENIFQRGVCMALPTWSDILDNINYKEASDGQ